MARLSTHVLDTTSGLPAPGVAIELSIWRGDRWEVLKKASTNADGRTDEPLLAGSEIPTGEFRLVFDIGRYFRARGATLLQPPFLERVPIEFGIAEAHGHYHVPLLCTPWSYSTYRGS